MNSTEFHIGNNGYPRTFIVSSLVLFICVSINREIDSVVWIKLSKWYWPKVSPSVQHSIQNGGNISALFSLPHRILCLPRRIRQLWRKPAVWSWDQKKIEILLPRHLHTWIRSGTNKVSPLFQLHWLNTVAHSLLKLFNGSEHTGLEIAADKSHRW